MQKVRDDNNWEEWILFMLYGVEKTAKDTTKITYLIKDLVGEYKNKLRNCNTTKRIYSQDLVNTLFKHTYTRISFVEKDLNINRDSAAKYLKLICDMNLLTEVKIGRNKYFINEELLYTLINWRDKI